MLIFDGTVLAPTVFGSTDSNNWRVEDKSFSFYTYGTNGYSILKDGNTITDQSANSNNFSLGGGTLTKTEDSPSNVFATWNPTNSWSSYSTNVTYSHGNTYCYTRLLADWVKLFIQH